MSTQPSHVASDDTQAHIVGAAGLDFTMVVTSIMRDPSLSHAARTLYTILVSYASINGGQRGVWPSVATLAEHMGCSASSTRRYLHELVNAGIITVTERRNEDGGQTSNLITLHDKGRLVGAHPPFHPRQEAPTTRDKAPLPPVTPKQEPLEQEPRNKKNTPLPPTDETDPPLESFEDFWAMYPKKEDKGTARRAWATATKKTTGAVICAALQSQLPILMGIQRKFVPYPARWLNGERWADEAPAVRDRRIPEGWVTAPSTRRLGVPEGW